MMESFISTNQAPEQPLIFQRTPTTKGFDQQLLELARMIIFLAITKNQHCNFVFISDSEKNKKYVKQVFDEVLSSIPSWMINSIEKSRFKYQLNNSCGVYFFNDPKNLIGLTCNSIYYFGGSEKIGDFKDQLMMRFCSGFSLVIIKPD